jgi:hypothetical protein
MYFIPKYIWQKITRIRRACNDNSHAHLNLLTVPAIFKLSDASDKDDKCGPIKKIRWGSRYDDVSEYNKRLRWSRGTVLAFGTQVRGFKLGVKFLNTPSFGRAVKPSVPCRRFTTCKRPLNATWKSGISGKIHRPFHVHIVPPLATRISGETTSGESWNV